MNVIQNDEHHINLTFNRQQQTFDNKDMKIIKFWRTTHLITTHFKSFY